MASQDVESGIFVESPQESDVTGPLIWAIDPLGGDEADRRTLLDAIELWRAGTECKIIPVSVVSQREMTWPAEVVAPLNDNLVYIANNKLRPLLKRVQVEDLDEPRVLMQRGTSRRGAVQALIDFAQNESAEIIAAHSHSRKGLKRLGSFTEALIALSPVPTLIVPADAVVPLQIKTVLFPTDFSKSSWRILSALLPWAKRWEASISITHVYDVPYQSVIDAEGGLGIDPRMIERYWQEAEAEQRSEGERWASEVSKVGVPCDFDLSMSNGWTGERIVEAASRLNADIVAMGTHRGLVGQTILGSVARDVMTMSKRPVVIIRESERTSARLQPNPPS